MFHHHHICKSETIIIYLDRHRVMSLKTHDMATISIDIESNKADLDALVAQLNEVLAQIAAFQLAFTVTEIPTEPTV